MRVIIVTAMVVLVSGCTNAKLDHVMAVNTALTHEREGLQQSVLALETAYSQLGRDSNALRSSFSQIEAQVKEYGAQIQGVGELREDRRAKEAKEAEDLVMRLQSIEEQLQVSLVRQDRVDRLVKVLEAKIRQKESRSTRLPQKLRGTSKSTAKVGKSASAPITSSTTIAGDGEAGRPEAQRDAGSPTGFDASRLKLPTAPDLRYSGKSFKGERADGAEAGESSSSTVVSDPVISTPPTGLSSGPVSLQIREHVPTGDTP